LILPAYICGEDTILPEESDSAIPRDGNVSGKIKLDSTCNTLYAHRSKEWKIVATIISILKEISFKVNDSWRYTSTSP
jgi:hypothetical protein